MNQNGRFESGGSTLVTETENDATSRIDNEPTLSTDNSLTVADSSMPSFSDSVLEIIDKPSVFVVRKCLGRLATVFQPNSEHFFKEIDCASEVYANLLKGYSDEQVAEAILVCAKTLRHFPFPADLIEAIKGPSHFIGAI